MAILAAKQAIRGINRTPSQSTTEFWPRCANWPRKSQWNRAPAFQAPELPFHRSVVISTRLDLVGREMPLRFVRTVGDDWFEIYPQQRCNRRGAAASLIDHELSYNWYRR